MAPSLLLGLLLLLVAVTWAGAPVWYQFEDVSQHLVLSYGLPSVQRSDWVTTPQKSTNIGVCEITTPIGLTCDTVVIDVPAGRVWPSLASLIRDPTRAHIFRWSPPNVPVLGDWTYNQPRIDTSWTFSTPSNGSWGPRRALGLYRFTLGGGNTTWLGGTRYALGFYVELAGTLTTTNVFEWLAVNRTSVGAPGRFSDIYGNWLANKTAADPQKFFTLMPAATAMYTSTHAPMTYLGLTAYALCRGLAPANVASFATLPNPSWTTATPGPPPSPPPPPSVMPGTAGSSFFVPPMPPATAPGPSPASSTTNGPSPSSSSSSSSSSTTLTRSSTSSSTASSSSSTVSAGSSLDSSSHGSSAAAASPGSTPHPSPTLVAGSSPTAPTAPPDAANGGSPSPPSSFTPLALGLLIACIILVAILFMGGLYLIRRCRHNRRSLQAETGRRYRAVEDDDGRAVELEDIGPVVGVDAVKHRAPPGRIEREEDAADEEESLDPVALDDAAVSAPIDPIERRATAERIAHGVASTSDLMSVPPSIAGGGHV